MYHFQAINPIGLSLSVDASQHYPIVLARESTVFRYNQSKKVGVNLSLLPAIPKLGSRLIAEVVYFNQITDVHFMLPVNGVVKKFGRGAFHHFGRLFLTTGCGAGCLFNLLAGINACLEVIHESR